VGQAKKGAKIIRDNWFNSKSFSKKLPL